MNAEQDKPFRPMLRIWLIPFLMGVAWFAPGWPHAAPLAFVAIMALVTGTGHALGAALIAWCKYETRHAAIEGAGGLLMFIATIMAIFGAVIWVVPEGGFT